MSTTADCPSAVDRGSSSDARKRPSLPHRGGLPYITVVVPVRNEARHLEQTLGPLLSSRYPTDRYEILIVDGRSTDGTRAIAEELAKRYWCVRVFDNPRRLSSGARNIGIANARGDIILIVDGHCQVGGPQHLEEVARAFEKSGADCLGRPQPLDIEGASPLQRAIALARSSWLGHHPDSFIYANQERFVEAKSVAVAYRKSVFDKVGLFDESFDACEDVELNHRVDLAGLRCYFTPKIAVGYHPRSSLPGLFRQMLRYGRGRARLLRKHRETFSPGSLLPACWLLGIILGPLVCIALPSCWRIYLAAVATYFVLVVLASAHAVIRARQASLAALVASTLITVHAGAGWGFIEGFVLHNKR